MLVKSIKRRKIVAENKQLKFKIGVVGGDEAARDIGKVDKSIKKAGVEAKKTSKGFQEMRVSTAGLRRSVGVLRNNLLLVSFTVGALMAGIKKLVELSKKQYEAEVKLARALGNVASAAEDGAARLIDLASAYQKITTFGDESIIEMQAMLATFQLNETAIAKLTPRVLDLAAATGQDLNSAAIMVGKSFTGQTGAMSRAGVVLDQQTLSIARAAGEVDEFNFLLEQMDLNFKGIAEALGRTEYGKIEQMKNEIADMGEELGTTLLPLSKAWTEHWLGVAKMGTLLHKTAEEVGGIGAFFEKLIIAPKQLDRVMVRIKRNMEGTTSATQDLLSELLRLRNLSIDLEQIQEKKLLLYELEIMGGNYRLTFENQLNVVALKKLQIQELYTAGLITATEKTIELLKLDKQHYAIMAQMQPKTAIEAWGFAYETEINNVQGMLSSFTASWGENLDERVNAEISALKDTARYQNADAERREDMERGILQKYAKEQKLKFRISQASAIAEIGMNTASALMKSVEGAWVTLGQPWFSIIAGLGVAQAAMVLSQKPPEFHSGGLVGGQGDTPIMAQSGEFVLSRSAVQDIGVDTAQRINQGGGAGITVNITAPLVDETVVESIIPAIETAIRRNQSNILMS